MHGLEFLQIVLLLKIILTIIWAGLFLVPSRLRSKFLETSPANIWSQLLGMAYFSLLINYTFGLYQTFNSIFPFGPVIVGIISNGGASLILVTNKESWTNWSNFKRNNILISILFTSVISVTLLFILIFELRSL